MWRGYRSVCITQKPRQSLNFKNGYSPRSRDVVVFNEYFTFLKRFRLNLTNCQKVVNLIDSVQCELLFTIHFQKLEIDYALGVSHVVVDDRSLCISIGSRKVLIIRVTKKCGTPPPLEIFGISLQLFSLLLSRITMTLLLGSSDVARLVLIYLK